MSGKSLLLVGNEYHWLPGPLLFSNMLSTEWRWETDLRNPSVFGEALVVPGEMAGSPSTTTSGISSHTMTDYSKLVYFGLGLYVLKSVLSKRLNFKKKDGG